MNNIIEIRNAIYIANSDKKKLEDELSKRLRFVIEAELNEIKKQFGSMPKKISVEMINSQIINHQTVDSDNDNFILELVEVKI